MRFRTLVTGEDYVTGKLWRQATIPSCPWCPDGRCTLWRHGTYERVTPAGCHVPRWYCPATGCTVSALPDCLAAHRTGTLAEREASVRAIETAGSLAAATDTERTDILLPGALRYLGRLRRDLYAALAAVRGLDPERFVGCAITLASFAALLDTTAVFQILRADYERHLGELPAPLGFDPHRIARDGHRHPPQHRAGRDPPHAVLDACRPVHTESSHTS